MITFGVAGLSPNINQSVKLTCQHILTAVIRWFQTLLPTPLPSDYTPKLKNSCKLKQKFHDGAIYYQPFREMCSLQLQARINPQGGGSRFVKNTSKFVQDNMRSHPKDGDPQNLKLQARINPQGGGSRFVKNTSKFVQDNMRSHPKDCDPQNLELPREVFIMNCLQTFCNTHVKCSCMISLSKKACCTATTVVQQPYFINSVPQQTRNTQTVTFQPKLYLLAQLV